MKQTWRLTEEQRQAVIYLYCWGEPLKLISYDYNVSSSAICQLAPGRDVKPRKCKLLLDVKQVKRTWRLTKEQRQGVIYLYCWGEKTAVIAAKYDVTESCVRVLAFRNGFRRKRQ